MIFIMFFSMIIIMYYNKIMVFILIGLEMLNLSIMLYFIIKMNIYVLFFILIIQIFESVIIMMLLFKNFSMWENYKSWSIYT